MDNSLDAFFAALADYFSIRHDPVETLQLFVLAVARWAPVFSLAPFLGGQLVPASIKLGLSVCTALWLLPGLSASAPLPLVLSEVTWWALLSKELVLGFGLAFAGSLVFWAAEMGGKFIDNVRGTTTANLLLPQVSVQSSLLGAFYFQLFIVLFILGGGHLWFLGAVFRSYEAFPPLQLNLAMEGIATGLAAAVGGLFEVMLRIIAPPLACLMLLDLMLGVTNRMAPQLDVFFISLSLKATLGALLVALSIHFLSGLFGGLVLDHQIQFHDITGIEAGP